MKKHRMAFAWLAMGPPVLLIPGVCLAPHPHITRAQSLHRLPPLPLPLGSAALGRATQHFGTVASRTGCRQPCHSMVYIQVGHWRPALASQIACTCDHCSGNMHSTTRSSPGYWHAATSDPRCCALAASVSWTRQPALPLSPGSTPPAGPAQPCCPNHVHTTMRPALGVMQYNRAPLSPPHSTRAHVAAPGQTA